MLFINRKINIRRAMTLVELLITTALVAVISLAIYSTLNSAIKIWSKVQQAIPEEDVVIFLERFTSDLRNTFAFAGINFLGEDEKLEFPTLVLSPRMNNRTVGKVVYYYDSGKWQLARQQSDYSGVYSQESPQALQVLANVRRLKFLYYDYDPQKKEYFWEDEWSKEKLPLAVRVEFELSGNSRLFRKTVNIPVSVKGKSD